MRGLAKALALLIVVLASSSATAQRPDSAAENERERQFVEALQREDPASAERYVALRDARQTAFAELRRVEQQYNAAGPELRGIFVRQLREAERKYAETALALLDFFDARDRGLVARYQQEIIRINGALEERSRARRELESLLGRR